MTRVAQTAVAGHRERIRIRIRYLLCVLIVIPLGLGSRRFGAELPRFIAEYAGDTLWALMVFFLLGVLAPQTTTRRRALVALTISYADEISQLYHAPWIGAVRHTRLGGLVLGFQFVWSDLVCYTVGVVFGTAIDSFIRS